MDANENENETADGVREYDDDSINKGIDTEESVVPENGTELLVFEKKDIRSKDFIGVPIIIFATVFVRTVATADTEGGIPDMNFLYVRNATAVEKTVLNSLSLLVASLAFLYGIIIDVFPIYGLSWKSYTLLGLVIMCSFLITIASYGDTIGTMSYSIFTALVSLGVEISFTAIKGYIPWVTKREPRKNKGYFQSVMAQTEAVAGLLSIFYMLVVVSSPSYTCAGTGYEQDPSTSCSTDAKITNQNPLSQTDPDNWCHDACPAAWYSFNPSFALMYGSVVVFLCVLIVPSLVFLKEGKKVKGHFQTKIKSIWVALTRRSLWQLILFSLMFFIMTNIGNPAEDFMVVALMGVEPREQQICGIISFSVAVVCIYLYMKFFLKSSRRKLLIAYVLFLVTFELIKLLPVYNVTRSKAIYYIMNLPDGITLFIPTLIVLNAINGIIEPGQETTVHALIASCINFGKVGANATINLPILAFFPSLMDTATISNDTAKMKNEYLKFEIIIVILNFLAIFSLPMLPRQVEESQVLYETNERSTLWATVTTVSFMVMFLYSVVDSFVNPTSTAFSYTIIAITLLWCLAIPACVIYLPMVRKKEKFDWSMFI